MAKSDHLTTGEVAELCGVNYRTVIRWIERGLLEASRLPGRGDRRIHYKEAVRFMEEQKIPNHKSKIPTKTTRSVLIIEDEPYMAASLKRSLHHLNFETSVALNGLNAGMQLVDLKPDLVTVDLKLKHSSGVEVIKLIRSQPSLSNTKVLIISGAGYDELALAAAAGADAFLPKPFTSLELVRELDKLNLIEKEIHE